MGIIVENGGILTTVQDEGRFGYQAFGVSTSGAMDNHSFHIANILVDTLAGTFLASIFGSIVFAETNPISSLFSSFSI